MGWLKPDKRFLRTAFVIFILLIIAYAIWGVK